MSTWPTRTSRQHVQQFLSLNNYYHQFIRDFATIAKPLSQFDRKNLTSSPVLAHPDFTKSFVLECHRIRSCALPVSPGWDGMSDSLCQPNTFEARTSVFHNPPQTLDRGHIIEGFSNLLGCQFTPCTDHGLLTWLHNFKEPDGQLAHWITALQEYDFLVENRQGKSHRSADALTCNPEALLVKADIHPSPPPQSL